MKNTIYTLISACLLLSCRKENPEKIDQVMTQDVKGMVFNNCTDSGLAGIKVYFQVFLDEKKIVENIETTSGKDGSFLFKGVNIHSNNAYTYAVYIKSQSGDGAPFASLSRFTGTTIYFHNYESQTFLKPRVTPGFFILTLYLNTAIISTANDSVIAMFKQLKYKNNVPGSPYMFGGGSYGNQSTQKGNIGHYPMGLYNITIDKWRGGVHTTSYDSIYLGWAGDKTYTVNW